MTDEEMAEEYASSSTSDRGYYYEGLKEGFLDGLKAGIPKWHKVADGDLPEDNKIVLFYTTYFDFWIGGIEPKNDKKHRWEVFLSVSGDYYAEDEVIAWCEIPKYTEE